jgi:hypothetical protein
MVFMTILQTAKCRMLVIFIDSKDKWLVKLQRQAFIYEISDSCDISDPSKFICFRDKIIMSNMSNHYNN